MRYKPEHKEATHRKIVESASREFRAQGIDGVGIAKLMGTLNLTHGGFYAHFADKEGLVDESLALALDETLAEMVAALKAGGLPALLDYYLSPRHRDNPALGCPLPALAADLSRRAPAARDAFTARLSQVFATVGELLPGQPSPQKEAKVAFLFASMAGAVSLARVVSDPALAQSLLDATRAPLEHLFDEKAPST